MDGSNSVKANGKTRTKRCEKANAKSSENAKESQREMGYPILTEWPSERKPNNPQNTDGAEMGFLFS